MAERAGLPAYLESSPKAYPLYQKLGFEKLSESIVHKPDVTGGETDVEVPLMVKMPSCAHGVGFEEWAKKGYPQTYVA